MFFKSIFSNNNVIHIINIYYFFFFLFSSNHINYHIYIFRTVYHHIYTSRAVYTTIWVSTYKSFFLFLVRTQQFNCLHSLCVVTRVKPYKFPNPTCKEFQTSQLNISALFCFSDKVGMESPNILHFVYLFMHCNFWNNQCQLALLCISQYLYVFHP